MTRATTKTKKSTNGKGNGPDTRELSRRQAAPTGIMVMKPEELEVIGQKMQEIQASLLSYTTPALVDLFVSTKTVGEHMKKTHEAARKELIERKEEEDWGLDDKGHRYRAGGIHGVKLERRVSQKLLPDAAETLSEYLHMFPREFDAVKAEAYLREQGVDEAVYTTPVVDAERLGHLYGAGIIPKEVAMACLDEKSITWAAKPNKPDKVVT